MNNEENKRVANEPDWMTDEDRAAIDRIDAHVEATAPKRQKWLNEGGVVTDKMRATTRRITDLQFGGLPGYHRNKALGFSK